MLKDQVDEKHLEPSTNRLLLLDITDGMTQLKGMEYKPLPMLDSRIKPGAKVMYPSQLIL